MPILMTARAGCLAFNIVLWYLPCWNISKSKSAMDWKEFALYLWKPFQGQVKDADKFTECNLHGRSLLWALVEVHSAMTSCPRCTSWRFTVYLSRPLRRNQMVNVSRMPYRSASCMLWQHHKGTAALALPNISLLISIFTPHSSHPFLHVWWRVAGSW